MFRRFVFRRFVIAYATSCAGEFVLYLLRDSRRLTAAKCRLPLRPLLVKMCLERPAGRDKHENKNKISAEDAQSETEGILNRLP